METQSQIQKYFGGKKEKVICSFGSSDKKVCKASVHLVFLTETAGSEKPRDFCDLRSVLTVDSADTVEESRILQISCLENVEMCVKKRIQMSEKLKTQSKQCELIPIHSLFRPRKFYLIMNLPHILRRQLEADAIQSFED